MRASAGGQGISLPAQVSAGQLADWVTKTELMTYVRCPYTYTLLWRGELSRDELFDPFLLDLLADGIAFHEQVNASVPEVEVSTAADVERLLADGVTVYDPPMFLNAGLHIWGIPDAVDPADGAFVPVEIKMHKDIQRTDRLELAFYWLLLEPYRTAKDADPRGRLVLRRDGEPFEVEVPLSDQVLSEVQLVLAQLRQARIEPPRARFCGCHVCSVVRRDEVRAAAAEARDVSLLFEVGPRYREALEHIGITSYDQLIDRDPGDIVLLVDAYLGTTTPLSRVVGWQHHAKAYLSGRANLYGRPLRQLSEPFIVLDLEYLTPPFGERLFLVGAGFALASGRTHISQIWADDTDDAERRLLDQLSWLLAQHPRMTVVTWAGKSADLPTLRKAAVRLGVRDPLDGREHCDLFYWAQQNLRLPAPSLGLKELAQYFGVARASDVGGGLEAQFLYKPGRSGKVPASNRDRLQTYNRDDVETTLELARKLRSLRRATQRREGQPGTNGGAHARTPRTAGKRTPTRQ